MSNIFSKWSYTTEEGIEIAMPSGISKLTRVKKNGRLRIVVSGLEKASTAFCATEPNVRKMLAKAVETLLMYYQSGKPINKFHSAKKPGSYTGLPPGLSLIGVEDRPVAGIQVHYPCISSGKIRIKYFTLGKRESYTERLEAVTKEAIEFREKQIELYRLEFIRRLKDCLRKLKGGSVKVVAKDYWFELATASHPDPSKLTKGELSFCLAPIQLPDGCHVVGGIPAALIVARSVGDNTGIEWMAIDSGLKQALCEAVLQSEDPVFNQWFQLKSYGSTIKPKAVLIDELRRGILNDAYNYTEKFPLL